MSTPGAARCRVTWTWRAAVATGARLLDDTERGRLDEFATEGDRSRFVTATALAKHLVGEELGRDPRAVALDRTCASCGRVHGRPRLPGTGLHLSIAHSGDVVGVALTRAGPVGLDVEAVAAEALGEVAERVIGPGEQAGSAEELLRYWVRKEAATKATGDGLGVDLRGVLVSSPADPARLTAYPGRSASGFRLADLRVRDGYAGSVAILTRAAVEVVESWSGPHG